MSASRGEVPGLMFDVCVVGGGVLGTCIAFWVSNLFDLSIALVDMEDRVATHASSRNTGVVHRPFYMNPEKKKRFAWAANKSFGMWEKLAKEFAEFHFRGDYWEVTDTRALSPVLSKTNIRVKSLGYV